MVQKENIPENVGRSNVQQAAPKSTKAKATLLLPSAVLRSAIAAPMKENVPEQASRSDVQQASRKSTNAKATLLLPSAVLRSDARPCEQRATASATKPALEECYDVRHELGKGAYGKVCLGIPRSGGPARAIKTTLKCDQLQHLDSDESSILRGLDHPNICKLFDVHEDPWNVHLVLEYVQGRDLFDVVNKNGAMAELRAAMIMKQVFSACEYLHRSGVIHRDIKPENIMLNCSDASQPSEYDDVKLIDFGSAIMCRGTVQTPKHSAASTPCYAAPEVLEEGKYSAGSDMYSVGATLCVLLSGEEFSPTPSAFKPSRLARDMIDGLLHKTVEERFTAAGAGRHDWVLGSLDTHKDCSSKSAIDHARSRGARCADSGR
jgi:serine/threonine protein kinase